MRRSAVTCWPGCPAFRVADKLRSGLALSSVKSRLASESGISFTEFSYQLLQAQDFLHLHLNHGCAVQLGGSDQWGNIVAGIDLIHRHYADVTPALASDSAPSPGKKRKEAPKAARQERAFGLTIPLLTTASGEKFGKSAGNAIWLDERLTSFFDFYQVRMSNDADGLRLGRSADGRLALSSSIGRPMPTSVAT